MFRIVDFHGTEIRRSADFSLLLAVLDRIMDTLGHESAHIQEFTQTGWRSL
jgi:hypothetical protein